MTTPRHKCGTLAAVRRNTEPSTEGEKPDA